MKALNVVLLTGRVAREVVVTTVMGTACGVIAAGTAWAMYTKQRAEAFVAREAAKQAAL